MHCSCPTHPESQLSSLVGELRVSKIPEWSEKLILISNVQSCVQFNVVSAAARNIGHWAVCSIVADIHDRDPEGWWFKPQRSTD